MSKRMFAVLFAVAFSMSLFAAEVYNKEASKGGIRGVISFEGEAPRRGQIDIAGDKYCQSHHKDAPLMVEDVVVNDGKLQNVVIYISSGSERYKDYPVPAETLLLDQVGCQYKPHVLVAQLGQKIEVQNGDDAKHNVHLKGPAGDLNISQDAKGQKDAIPDSKLSADFISIGCDIHKWMSAKLAIFDHPFFAISNEKGEFEIKHVPDGEYTLSVWHERAGNKVIQPEPVKIKIAGGVITQNFSFKKQPK
jgi:hypothetical protein